MQQPTEPRIALPADGTTATPVVIYRQPLHVTVKSFDMPFWQLVQLLVKIAIAMIPATIILAIIGIGIAALVAMATGFIHGVSQ